MKLKKLIMFVIAGIVIAYITGCMNGVEQEPGKESLAEMISEEAGLCREFMEVLFRTETHPPRHVFSNESLTAAIILAAAPIKELEPKFEGPPPPGLFLRVLSDEAPTDTFYFSFIRPEWVTSITRERSEDQLEGVVNFENKYFVGKAHYVAKYEDEKWKIVEISMPRSGIVTRLGEDGNWETELSEDHHNFLENNKHSN